MPRPSPNEDQRMKSMQYQPDDKNVLVGPLVGSKERVLFRPEVAVLEALKQYIEDNGGSMQPALRHFVREGLRREGYLK